MNESKWIKNFLKYVVVTYSVLQIISVRNFEILIVDKTRVEKRKKYIWKVIENNKRLIS